jgi:hypothetical protein
MKVWKFRRDWRENFLLPSSAPSLSIAASRKYCSFYGLKQTLVSQLRYRVHSVFCGFIVNSNIVESFHHAIAMKNHSAR